jgi:hypothetical protein
METLYVYCAAIGLTLLIAQLLLSLFGLGHHVDLGGGHDVDLHTEAPGTHGDAHADHYDRGGHWYVGILSFRSIVSAIAVFGFVGLGFQRQFDPPAPLRAFILALTAGVGMLYAVGWLLRFAYGLRSDGTVRIEGTVGLGARTYLTIPAHKSGIGKVTVKIQGRTMEYAAMTCEDEIPTGTAVVVCEVLTPETVEVARAATESPLPVEGPAHV